MRLREPARRAIAAATLLLVLVPAVVRAADPSPTAAAAGDPRSSGQGPGLVGDPVWAIGIVVGIAVVSLVLSLAWVRMTAGRQPDPPPR